MSRDDGFTPSTAPTGWVFLDRTVQTGARSGGGVTGWRTCWKASGWLD